MNSINTRPSQSAVSIDRFDAEVDGRRVVTFDFGRDPALLAVLNQLSFHTESAQTRSADLVLCENPLAVIVSDAIEDPLELCKVVAATCPVILLSDETSFEFRNAAAAAGINALIRRPVNPLELSEWLEYFASRHSSSPISVVIVDDDRLSSALNAAILRQSGMTVSTVSDPTRMLQILEDSIPDLILMDLQMPEVDGARLTQVIRQSRQLISLPIIFLSAERDEDRQLTARRLGGDDFIVKPVQPDKLIALVRLRADRSKTLRSLIERDRLTGLFNRSRFEERLCQEVERCRRSGAEICVVMIDLDGFKQVNDRYGHPSGDAVLRGLSCAMIAGLRRIDVIGRYGGEEFGVILLDTGLQAAKFAVDRIRERFSQIIFESGPLQFSVSFSAGVASSRDQATVADLIAAADRALYDAKSSGRDCVRLADRADPSLAANRAAERLGSQFL